MATNFIGKISFFGQPAFICRTGVPIPIGIPKRRWAEEKQIEYGYIVYEFVDI